jgi:hypothetical protein
MTYCILTEDEYGTAPPYARIQYADRWFDEPYTPARKKWALHVARLLRDTRKRHASFMTALSWGWSIEDTAVRLMQESSKGRENGERYALRTAENAAAAVAERNRQRSRALSASRYALMRAPLHEVRSSPDSTARCLSGKKA